MSTKDNLVLALIPTLSTLVSELPTLSSPQDVLHGELTALVMVLIPIVTDTEPTLPELLVVLNTELPRQPSLLPSRYWVVVVQVLMRVLLLVSTMLPLNSENQRGHQLPTCLLEVANQLLWNRPSGLVPLPVLSMFLLLETLTTMPALDHHQESEELLDPLSQSEPQLLLTTTQASKTLVPHSQASESALMSSHPDNSSHLHGLPMITP